MAEPHEKTHLGRQAHETGQAVKERAEAELNPRKASVARDLDGIAHALTIAADDLQHRGQGTVASYAKDAAQAVGQLSDRLANKNLRELVDDAQQVFSDNLMVMAGVAALAGFLGARFVRSSSSSHQQESHEEGIEPVEPWPQPHSEPDIETRRGVSQAGYQRPAEPFQTVGPEPVRSPDPRKEP